MKRSFLTFLALLLAVSPALAQEAKPSPAPVAAATTTTDTPPAVFAGGCFWCMQYAFDKVKGVKKTVVGYTGGQTESPAYEEVSSGTTGHAESIEVYYDPAVVSYPQLLDTFWKSIDPTAVNGQFADRGTQYRTAIFYHNDAEKKAAEASKAAFAKIGNYDKPIATQIVPATAFYPAEDEHQEYYQKNPTHFNAYEIGSGRAGYLKRRWGTEFPH